MKKNHVFLSLSFFLYSKENGVFLYFPPLFSISRGSSFFRNRIIEGRGEEEEFLKKNSFFFFILEEKQRRNGIFYTFLLCFRSREEDRIKRVFFPKFLEIELSEREGKEFFKKNYLFFFFILGGFFLYFPSLFLISRRIELREFFGNRIIGGRGRIFEEKSCFSFSFFFSLLWGKDKGRT